MENQIDYSTIQLNRKSPEPLHIQLKNALLKAMRSIPSNQKTILMSEREIAQMLGVPEKTVTTRLYRARGKLKTILTEKEL